MYRSILIFLKKYVLRLEVIYAAIALLSGLFFIFLIPPGWNPDEPQHYWRAQQAAHGNIIPDNFPGPPGITYTGGSLPTNDINFIQSFKIDLALQDSNYRSKFPAWNDKGAMLHETENAELGSVAFPGAARYSPVAYLPQIAGIWIGKVLGISLLKEFYLAKIIGLLLQVACFFLAIRLIPKAKWSLFTLGLLPSTIIQSTAFGGDVMTNSVCVLFIALVLNIAFTKSPIGKYRLGLVMLLVLLLGLVKPTYLPLVGILTVIPVARKQYRNMRHIAIATLAVLVLALPGVLWVKSNNFVQDHFSNGVNSQAQTEYVRQYPLRFMSTTVRTYLTDEQPRTYKNLFGNFIWDTAPIPLIFMFLGITILTISSFTASPREIQNLRFSPLVKVVLLSIFILISTLISYALYVYFTPLRERTILGIQGRYFIPLLPLILVMLHNPLPHRSDRIPKFIILCGIIALLLCSTVVLVDRIYA